MDIDATTAILIGAVVTGLCSLLSVGLSQKGSWTRGLITGLAAASIAATAMLAYFNYSHPSTPTERNLKAWAGDWKTQFGGDLGSGQGTTTLKVNQFSVQTQILGSFTADTTKGPIKGTLRSVDWHHQEYKDVHFSWSAENGMRGDLWLILNDDRKTFSGWYGRPSGCMVFGSCEARGAWNRTK
jgi:hypothetical protein